MSEAILELENVTVWRGSQRVFHEFSLRMERGERVAVLGANGAGKSTLLELLTGGVRAAWVEGSRAALFGEKNWSLQELRGRMGLVMPEQARAFLPDERSFDVVLSAFRGAVGRTDWMEFSEEEEAKSAAAIELVGMTELARRPFAELSSGEKRRFLLARALVLEPEVLVLDEATTALDLPTAWRFLETVRGLCRTGTSLMMVTHDVREIPPEVERVVILKEGRVLADGPKEEVLTAELLGACYGLAVEVDWHEGFCRVAPSGNDVDC